MTDQPGSGQAWSIGDADPALGELTDLAYAAWAALDAPAWEEVAADQQDEDSPVIPLLRRREQLLASPHRLWIDLSDAAAG